MSDSRVFFKNPRLRDQMRRQAASMMHDMAERYDAGSERELIRFLKCARRSASEGQSQFCTIQDRRYIAQEDSQRIYHQVTSVRKLINAFVSRLRRSQ